MFRSFSFLLLKNQGYHRNIRLLIVREILNKWNSYECGITAPGTYNVQINSRDQYEQYMKRDGIWGANPEIIAFSVLFASFSVAI